MSMSMSLPVAPPILWWQIDALLSLILSSYNPLLLSHYHCEVALTLLLISRLQASLISSMLLSLLSAPRLALRRSSERV